MIQRSLWICIVLLAGLIGGIGTLAGCSQRTVPATSSPVSDSGPGMDKALPPQPDLHAPDQPIQTGPWSFVPDLDQGKSPVVFLRLESLHGQQATLSVVGRGLSSLQGVAFRLTFGPQQLMIKETTAAAYWMNAPAATRFAVKTTGEVWAGLGFIGPYYGIPPATGEVLLAQVALTLIGKGPAQIAFRDHHNLILNVDGSPIQASWLGGVFTR